MKRLIAALTLMMTLGFLSESILAATDEEPFTAKGTITEIASAEKILHVKIEGGLELTFRVDDKTQIMIGDEVKTFPDIGANDEIEIEYSYNENYEKVARSIKKVLSFPAPKTP